MMVAVVPLPGALSTEIVPLIAVTTWFANHKPMPNPPCSRCVTAYSKRWKIRARSSSEMPIPWSAVASCALSPSDRKVTETGLPAPNLIAFVRRFSAACSTASLSHMPTTPSCRSCSIWHRALWAATAVRLIIPRTTAERSVSVGSIRMFPAAIRETSSSAVERRTNSWTASCNCSTLGTMSSGRHRFGFLAATRRRPTFIRMGVIRLRSSCAAMATLRAGRADPDRVAHTGWPADVTRSGGSDSGSRSIARPPGASRPGSLDRAPEPIGVLDQEHRREVRLSCDDLATEVVERELVGPWCVMVSTRMEPILCPMTSTRRRWT